MGAEQTHLRDVFGKARLSKGVYTPGMIDQAWTPDVSVQNIPMCVHIDMSIRPRCFQIIWFTRWLSF